MTTEWRRGLAVLVVLGAWLSAASAGTTDLSGTLSQRETEPEGWRDLLADFGQWERVAYSPKRPLVANSPWRWDPAAKILSCGADGIHEFLLFREPTQDGVLHVEWRYVGAPDKPNSGVLVRTSDDASTWLQAQLATSGLGLLSGLVKTEQETARFKAGERHPDLQRPPGEWNVMEVTCTGPEITLWINGRTVATLEYFPVRHGRLGLEAEFHPIQFRNILFKPR